MTEHTPTTPWKLFDLNGVMEIQTVKTEAVVIKWSGFDGSDFGDATNRVHAAFIVKACNNHEEIVNVIIQIKAVVTDNSTAPRNDLALNFIGELCAATLAKMKP